MHQIYYFVRLGLRPRPRWWRLQCSPRTHIVGMGPTSKEDGREGMGKEGRGLRKGREGRGRNVAFHHLLLSNLTTGM